MTDMVRNDPDDGKIAALAVYGLYLISVPSAFVLLPAGLILAYVARSGASPWVREHFDKAVRIGWAALIWGAVAWTLVLVGIPLSFILIGLPLWGAGAVIGFVLAVWLVITSVLNGLRLLGNRPA